MLLVKVYLLGERTKKLGSFVRNYVKQMCRTRGIQTNKWTVRKNGKTV